MANSVSMSQSIAGRYAQAVFDIVKEDGGLDGLAQQAQDLGAALHDSADLRDLISSPIYTRDDQARAIGALSQKMGLSPVLANTLQLMARNRRLFVLPQLVRQLQAHPHGLACLHAFGGVRQQLGAHAFRRDDGLAAALGRRGSRQEGRTEAGGGEQA